MDSYQETFQTWNKLAEAYRDRFMDFDLYHGTYDSFCSLLPKKASVLELGCGPGVIGKYLLKKRPDLQLLLTDVAPNMIKVAQQEVPEARTRVLDVRQINTITENFDAVVAGFVLPYLSEEVIVTLFEDLHELLKPRGWLYLSFVPGNASSSGFISGSMGDRAYFYFHSEETIHGILKNHGFTLGKEWRFPYSKTDGTEEIHTIIIAQRA